MGKVRDAIKVLKKQIETIQISMSTGDHIEATGVWKVFKKNVLVYQQLVDNMSGKSKTLGKAAKIEKFTTKINQFIDNYGSTLDTLAKARRG